MMSLLAAPALAGTVKVETDAVVGLQNEKVSIGFSRETGALVSLKNLATGDEYIKEPGGDGNPFRAYVDTTNLAKTLSISMPWPTQPTEDAMGGRLVDPKGCRMEKLAFRRADNAGTLSLTLVHARTHLQFDLAITQPDEAVWSDWQLTVRNTGEGVHTLMSAFPYLTGIGLGTNRATNLGVDLCGKFGKSGLPAWWNTGDIYGRRWMMQWNAVYEPADRGVFGFMVMDPDIRNKIFRRFPGGVMSTLYFPARTLAPGETVGYPVTRVYAYQGSWKRLARDYGDWFRKSFNLREPTGWLQEVDSYHGRWIPSVASVAQAKMQPDGPGVFASFRDLPRLYLNGHYDSVEWAMYSEGMLGPIGRGPDGMNTPRSDLGGVPALREGVARLHRMGRRITWYVASFSVDRRSELFKGENIGDWQMMPYPGKAMTLDVPNAVQVCRGYAKWQDHLAGMCKRLIQETGADGIRLDQGLLWNPCYNPAHRHESPFDGNKWMLELVRKVRVAMDEVDPQASLWVEGTGGDFMHQYIDASLQMGASYPGREMAPVHVSLPTFLAFGYNFGALESAHNGVPSQCLNMLRRCGWPTYHIKHPKPEGYPEVDRTAEPYEFWWGPGLGPRSRWHELRATFIDAWNTKETSDVDPTADNPRWWGRLWKTERYWLVTGGHDAGGDFENPVRVLLSELPADIESAYEIDAATLKVSESPLSREPGGIYLTLRSRFSAVLLPRPGCPPLVKMNRPSALKPGVPRQVEIGLFAPWRKAPAKALVTVDAAGLEMATKRLSLPGSIEITAPEGSEPGYYPLRVQGDCLPLRRWLVNDFVPPYIPFDSGHQSPSENRSDDYLPPVVKEWDSVP